MFSFRAKMVPTVALTPHPDQAEANWLLRVTLLSPPSSSLPPVSLSGVRFGRPEAAQCLLMPSTGRESLNTP